MVSFKTAILKKSAENCSDPAPLREIIQYIKTKKVLPDGREVYIPKGAMVAIEGSNGTFALGFSLCCKKDRFDKKRGRQMARERAVKFKERKYPALRYLSESEGFSVAISNIAVSDIVAIPATIFDRLSIFAVKVSQSFDQNMPVWAQKAFFTHLKGHKEKLEEASHDASMS